MKNARSKLQPCHANPLLPTTRSTKLPSTSPTPLSPFSNIRALPTSINIDMGIPHRRARNHHPMGMESRAADRRTPTLMQKAAVRLKGAQQPPCARTARCEARRRRRSRGIRAARREGRRWRRSVQEGRRRGRRRRLHHAEDPHGVAIRAHGENRRVLVHAQRPEGVPRRPDRAYALVPPEIPKLDLAVPARAHQLALPPALEMDVVDPRPMLLPHAHHGGLRLLALVVQTQRAVAKACDEEVPLHLIRGERCDGAAGAGVDVLQYR